MDRFSAASQPLLNVKLDLDGHLFHDQTIEFRYDHRAKIVFEWEEILPFSVVASGVKKAVAHLPGCSEEAHLLMARIDSAADSPSRVKFIPARQRIVLGSHQGVTKVVCTVINGPRMHFADRPLTMSANGFRYEYMEFRDIYEIWRSGGDFDTDTICTGELSITRDSGAEFSQSDLNDCLTAVSHFFNLVRGARSGIGHILGFNETGELNLTVLGFTRCDSIKCQTGWCDIDTIWLLPEVFERLTLALAVSSDHDAITNALEFYRASNTIRDSSIEMAIVASHTALETLVPHLLQHRGGWSTNLLADSSKFHDRLRSAVNLIGLSTDPLEHSPKLQAWSNGRNGIDAYEVISLFRNRLVHQGKPFKYSGVEIYEVWLLSQWLCEVFLFFMLNYRKKMLDRRRYTGWRGPSVDVPLR